MLFLVSCWLSTRLEKISQCRKTVTLPLCPYLEHVYPDRIDDGIWTSICRCLRGQYDSKSLPLRLVKERFHDAGETYEFAAGSPFKGIISHLRDECGGNVHSKGIVNITASSNCR